MTTLIRRTWQLFLYVWALPGTLIGLILVLMSAATNGTVTVRGGVIEAHGGKLIRYMLRKNRIPFIAITFGHTVVAVNQTALDITRVHERIHVEQYERWGPFFIPLYLSCSLIALMRGKNPYRDNMFEREAFDRDYTQAV